MTLSTNLSCSFALAMPMFAALAPQAAAQQERAQQIQIQVQQDTDWALLLVASDDAMMSFDGMPVLADARVLQLQQKGPVAEDGFEFAVELPVDPGIKRFYLQVVLYDAEKGLLALPPKLLEKSDQLMAHSDDPIYHPEDYPIKVKDLPAAHDSARVRPASSGSPDGSEPPTDQQLLEDSAPLDGARLDPRDPDAAPAQANDQQALEDAAPIDSARLDPRKPIGDSPSDDLYQAIDSVHAQVKDLQLKAGRSRDGGLDSFFASFTADTDGHDLQVCKVRGGKGVLDVFLYRKSPGKGEGMNDVVEQHDIAVQFTSSDMVQVWLATGDQPLKDAAAEGLTFQSIAQLER